MISLWDRLGHGTPVRRLLFLWFCIPEQTFSFCWHFAFWFSETPCLALAAAVELCIFGTA